jgi:hypothetical protein
MSQGGVLSSSSGQNPLVITSTPIDLKTTGSTLIFTATSNFIINYVSIYSSTLVGTPDFVGGSLGTNGPDYNNYSAVAPTFTAQGEFYTYTLNFYSLTAGSDFYLNVTTADTMSTTDLAIVYVQGFYV